MRTQCQRNGTIFQSRVRKYLNESTPALDFARMTDGRRGSHETKTGWVRWTRWSIENSLRNTVHSVDLLELCGILSKIINENACRILVLTPPVD
jgi:hypothetical protein